MFAHNKRLQYTVRVSETNPGLANLMLEQFGGPQGELGLPPSAISLRPSAKTIRAARTC